jgi:hypothetical protein
MAKVKITNVPRGNKGLNSNVAPMSFTQDNFQGSLPMLGVKNTLQPTDKENANVEAEVGEVVVSNFMKDGIPELYMVGGKDHSQGGTPLNLPQNSFVFSKNKKLKLSDPEIQQFFGKNKNGKSKKKYSMADLAKQYKLNNYRKALSDDYSDHIQRDTAELMIQNYVNKLGALSMVQESKKGFPEGIPAIAMGYLENVGIDPSSLMQPEPFGEAPQDVLKFGGDVSIPKISKKKVKITGLPTMQGGGSANYDANGNFIGGTPLTGGAPATTGKATKVQNIPDGAVKWDMSADGYDETQIRPGDYVKNASGSWEMVTGYKASPYTGGFEDPRLTGTGGDLQEPYGRLEQMVMDPNNDAFRADLILKHKENLQNTKPNSKTGLTQSDIDMALAMDDEAIISDFLEMQKQVFAVNASGIGGKGMDEADSWDKDRSNYVNTATDLGFTPLEPWQQAAFQSTYIGLNELSTGTEYGELLSDFRMAQEGRDDENLSGLRTGSISQIDGWVGNTTIGQGAIYKPVLNELNLQEVGWDDVPAPEVAPTLDVQPEAEPDAPWWLQDIIKTSGAAADKMRIKKHSPWQATPGVTLPQPTFYDPTRELAANAELANISTQGASVFGSPQAFNARASQIQGQAAKNVADTLGRYNNLNVQTANQFEMNKAQIMNNASAQKANLATQLYDKNVIANQQFDNAKNKARENMRQSYMDAITNRAQTQTLNELYPQYNVDPRTGGFMQFTEGRDLDPTQANQSSVMKTFTDYKNERPDVPDNILYKMAAADMGMPDNSPAGVDPAYFANYANMMP